MSETNIKFSQIKTQTISLRDVTGCPMSLLNEYRSHQTFTLGVLHWQFLSKLLPL